MSKQKSPSKLSKLLSGPFTNAQDREKFISGGYNFVGVMILNTPA